MSRRDRKLVRPRVLDALETRRLLSAAVISGNVGQVLHSQFEPFGFTTTVGTQLQGVKLSGPLDIHVVSASPAAPPNQTVSDTPINSGLIRRSQFNGGGFRTVGVQLKNVKIGGGLTVSGSSNDDPVVSADAGRLFLPSTVKNKGLISNTQFDDGGFGGLERLPDGSVVGHEGRVGLQWRNVGVRGSVSVGLDVEVVQPGVTTSVPAVSASEVSAAASAPGQTVIDPTTNSGWIRQSQVNDGGFGDIGFQWMKVSVGGRVATSSNSLFVNPTQDNGGPITIQNRVFDQSTTAAASQPVASESAMSLAASPSPSLGTSQNLPLNTTDTNSATNSGRIIGSQFNDGGFGDVGLQWKNVHVRGGVTAVHNSLTVQPENNGQGLITVDGVRFPAVPPASGRVARQSAQVLPTSPALVAVDGDPVGQTLPTPTGPLSPFFPTPLGGAGTVTIPYSGNYPLVNSATNSGLVLGGQFNAGGFGDQGLQWQNVRVGGHVQVVHNSLSVHPEGSGLAGISVSNVSYGPSVSSKVAKNLAVLPSAVISPGTVSAESVASVGGTTVLHPPNDRALTNQQLASTSGTDVFLQWNAIEHHRGLVLVHNIIEISGVGPKTGPITLSNIRFPDTVPSLTPLTFSATSTPTSGADGVTTAASQAPVLVNSANNSGVVNRAQFSDGGFGDDGFQWKNVRVDGSVEVVHNTLAVDESADLPAGDTPGPITVSNVTFNSGALKNLGSTAHNQTLASPPSISQKASSRPVNLGQALPQDPAVSNDATNSGILDGGQLGSGSANHVLLQWQNVRADGKVRVIDNVLSISVLDRPSAPISISNVTFA